MSSIVPDLVLLVKEETKNIFQRSDNEKTTNKALEQERGFPGEELIYCSNSYKRNSTTEHHGHITVSTEK